MTEYNSSYPCALVLKCSRCKLCLNGSQQEMCNVIFNFGSVFHNSITTVVSVRNRDVKRSLNFQTLKCMFAFEFRILSFSIHLQLAPSKTSKWEALLLCNQHQQQRRILHDLFVHSQQMHKSPVVSFDPSPATTPEHVRKRQGKWKCLTSDRHCTWFPWQVSGYSGSTLGWSVEGGLFSQSVVSSVSTFTLVDLVHMTA